ncbi:MAG: DNA polymerase III subunit epsilon [Gammaproteobacteria bacterium]|nr:DNA polymerase III subunit epsilon [Gammaproteobacteria bacterium]
MRQIVLDTETTGLKTEEGHRVIEIGCVELIDRQFTGNTLQYYINPERKVDAEALSVHGITNEFLVNKPIFSEILPDFLHFIGNDELIAHNAEFDIGFLNYEIQRANKTAKLLSDLVTVIDTLKIARKMFPGQRNSLDALCKRFKIDLSERKLHGALLDAHLLARVYLCLTGGQTTLFAVEESEAVAEQSKSVKKIRSKKRNLLIVNSSAEELSLHAKRLAEIKKLSGKCLWEDNDI